MQLRHRPRPSSSPRRWIKATAIGTRLRSPARPPGGDSNLVDQFLTKIKQRRRVRSGNSSVVVETLVSSKAPRKPRRVVFVGYVAGGARHAGPAAATGLRTVPRPVGMIFAHPARAVATRAFRPLPRRLGTKLAGHALTHVGRRDVEPTPSRWLSHLHGDLAVLAEIGLCAGDPRLGEFKRGHRRARRAIP